MLSALRLPVNKKAIEVGTGVSRAHPFCKERGKEWGTHSDAGRRVIETGLKGATRPTLPSVPHLSSFFVVGDGPSMSRGNPRPSEAWTGHPREQNEPMVWATRPSSSNK